MAIKRQPIAVFVSHSSKDNELVSCLLEAIKACFDIPDERIRCTSLVGYQLPGGSNIAATLQADIRNAKAMIGVLTPNSIDSPWVLCELGAVWGLVSHCIPLIAGLESDKLVGPLGVTHVWRLDNIDDVRSSLDELGRHLRGAARRRQRPKSIEDSVLERLVAFSTNYRPDTDVIPAAALYSLHLGSRQVRSDSNIFQDFDVSRIRGANVNPVQFLWADTFTNGNIRASVVTDETDKYLRIWFENGIRTQGQGELAKGWSSNIGIRPRENAAFGNANQQGELKHKVLQFSVRIPQVGQGDYLEEVGLSLRMLDRRLTYWIYTTSPGGKFPTQFRVTNAWQPVRVSLEPEFYSLYTGDGNRWYLKHDKEGVPIPDFTVLSGLTAILGRYTAGREEPQEGRGVVDIGSMTLTD